MRGGLARFVDRFSLGVAMAASDDAGNVRLLKKGFNNRSRDDVAAALTLAVGEFARRLGQPPRRLRYAA